MSDLVIEIESGSMIGESITLRGASIIGRDPSSCDVHIPDNFISRNHALISRVGTRWQLQDLGTVNGTILDGINLSGGQQGDLGEQGTVVFGGVQGVHCRYHTTAAAATRPPPRPERPRPPRGGPPPGERPSPRPEWSTIPESTHKPEGDVAAGRGAPVGRGSPLQTRPGRVDPRTSTSDPGGREPAHLRSSPGSPHADRRPARRPPAPGQGSPLTSRPGSPAPELMKELEELRRDNARLKAAKLDLQAENVKLKESNHGLGQALEGVRAEVRRLRGELEAASRAAAQRPEPQAAPSRGRPSAGMGAGTHPELDHLLEQAQIFVQGFAEMVESLSGALAYVEVPDRLRTQVTEASLEIGDLRSLLQQAREMT